MKIFGLTKDPHFGLTHECVLTAHDIQCRQADILAMAKPREADYKM